MADEIEMMAGADLPPYFARWVRALVGTIRVASEPGSAGTAAHNAGTYLRSIRANVATNTAEFHDALDAVLSAVSRLEGNSARHPALHRGHAGESVTARAAAINALAALVEILRSAEPGAKAKALG